MRSPERGGVSIAVPIGPSLGGVRGTLNVLNATVPIGRVRAPLNEGPVSLKHINLGWQPENTSFESEPEGSSLRVEDPRVSKDVNVKELNNMTILAKPISPKGEIRFKPGIRVLENPFPVTEPIKAPRAQSLRPRNLPAESFLMLVVARSILPAVAEIKSPLSQVIKSASHLESVVSPKTEAGLVFSQPEPYDAPVQAGHHDEKEEIEEPSVVKTSQDLKEVFKLAA